MRENDVLITSEHLSISSGMLLQDCRLRNPGIFGRQFGSLLEGGRGILVFAHFVHGQSQGEVGFRQLEIGLEGFPKMTFRHLPMALLGMADAFVVRPGSEAGAMSAVSVEAAGMSCLASSASGLNLFETAGVSFLVFASGWLCSQAANPVVISSPTSVIPMTLFQRLPASFITASSVFLSIGSVHILRKFVRMRHL